MNIENLNQAFAEIAEKKSKLSQIDRGSEEGKLLENNIRQLEESFQQDYGNYIEEVLFNVYDEYCPDDEVLKPSSYIAQDYHINKSGSYIQFDVDKNAGIEVDADDFPGIKARLVLVPNPTRLILQGEKENFREVVWSLRQPLEA